LRDTVRSKGGYYETMAAGLEQMGEEVGGRWLAPGLRLINEIIQAARKAKLTRSQYVMFLLADMMTWSETAHALCRKAVLYEGRERTSEFMKAAARLFVNETLGMIYFNGLKIIQGCNADMGDLAERLKTLELGGAVKGYLKDMDSIAAELVQS
jgi:hypothetical protein